jgi:hypothetical protein
VLDTTPPTFTVPADITLYTDANCSYSLAVSVTGDVTDEADNCTTVLDATFSDVSVPGCEGTEVVTRTWTLVDDCGNSLAQTQVITVLDTTPPTFTVPADITLYTDANCSYSLAVSVTGDVTDEDDNCTSVLDATFTDVSVPGCEGTEVVTRTWILVDDCGNSLVQTQVITVLDTTSPTFTVPADITIYSDANCVYDATVAATGDVTDEDDNCTSVLDATFSDVTVPGSCSGNWTITRTWTLVDNCGNSLVQTQVITVLDTTPPTFTVPANITLYTDAGCTYSTATSITGDVTDEADNCTALLNATFSDVTVPGACLGSYVVTRTWTLSDDCSNTTVKQQIITVLDTLDPIFVSCPANVTINCVNADTSTANLGFPVVTDNCSPLPDIDITYTDVILSYTCPGDYSFARTFTAVDDCGNSSSCTQIVTVIDTIVIACPADMVVCADDPAFALIGATPLGGTYSGTGVSGNVFDPALAGPGVHTITYTYTVDFCCVHTCTFSITVNPNPAAFNVTGGGAFCSGAIGVVVFLDGSEIGILYQLYNNGVATGPLVGGTGAQITFGYQNVAGNYTVIATNPVTGCTKLMTGSAAVVVHPLPVAFNVTGGGSYCAGGAGLDVGLDGSELGVNYELYLYGASTGQVVAGNGGLITFGPQTLAGNYTVHAVNASTLCESWMNGSVSITINPNPVVFNVTGGGNYCTGGPGVNVGLSYSELGISYELIHNGSNTGIVLTGTGSALDFGPQSTAGTYTIFATNTVTLCSALMNGSANVTINPLPLPYAVTGGGSYCSGGAGVVVGLANSQTGTNYELYLDGLSTGDTLLGTGSALSFGPQTATGTYTIVATIISTGCTNNMLGSVTVTLYPAPIVYNVTGGGSYCAGGAGVVVGLDGSEVGVDYELWLNGVATSVIISGTGSPVSFPAQTAAGTYTVQGIGVATACVNLMNGNAVISIDPLPIVFTVTGGGSYCAGGTGVPVGLSGSEAGLTYALHLNGVATGQIVGGTGAAISFGDQTAAGTYTIEGTNAATGCVNLMGGNAVVVIDPLPVAYTVTGGGVICVGSTGMNVGLSGSSVGILYELQLDGVNTGTLLGGTGSALNFGPQTVAGTYSILATNPITGCTNPMTGSVTVVVNPLPIAFTVTGGGAYCIGGTAPEVGLSGSETGITYELYRDGIGTGQLLGGTGLAITFGIQSTTGTYTVMATNTTTNCTEMMTGSVVVTMNTLPVAFAITGGGPYCQNSGGIGIGLAGSEIGVNYELYLNGNPTFNILAGTGTPLDFGLQIIAGTYTVMATNATTGCQSLMTGSTVVSIFINPIATAMSNSPVCEGDMIELFGGGAGCELAANTCNASSTSWFQEHITNVTLNGAVNSSVGSTYSDFTGNLLSTLFIGNTYSLSVTNFVDGSFDQYVSVFIDWNRDGDFSDAGEAMPIGNYVGTHTFNYSLSVPVGAEVGYTMMRVINQWGSAPLACGTFTYGEVEDYKIEVKSSVGPTCLYSWSGPAGFSSALQYPTIMPATSSNAGIYTVTVTDANGCTASATTTVVVNPLPAVSFSGLLPVYCSDDAPALLTGSPAGGTFSGQGISGSTFYPGIAGPGNWNIVYSYTNSFGCENSDTMNVTVNPSPVATTSADTTICQGGTAVVFAGGGSTYLWSTGSTNSAIFVSPLITTTYDVTVTNSFGCTDNASVTVNVNPVPLVNAGGDLEVCLGESIQLDVTATGAGPVYGYQWTPAVGLTDPTLKNPMASPTATTTYVVLVTSGLGCTASDDVVVTVNPLPNADAGQDMTLCFGTTTTLTATPAGMSYLWSTGQTSQSIVVVFGDTATYFVTVTNGFGCSAVDSVTLSSFPLPSAIVSPTQTICEFELA